MLKGPIHIPARRPGFEPDPSIIYKNPHPWGSYEAAQFESTYHSQYYLDRDRKPVYCGYPETQFAQVNNFQKITPQNVTSKTSSLTKVTVRVTI